MTAVLQQNGVTLRLDCRGGDRYTKISYPLRYGRYSEVETGEAVFQFLPGGEIAFARGKGAGWPDPQEWLKRTAGNDWVYYSTGGYTGVFATLGEYYLPNLQYPTNALIGGDPFANPQVRRIINGWHDQVLRAAEALGRKPPEAAAFFERIAANDPAVLAARARRLFQVSGGRVTVLPPDARHVDYDVIPLTISLGCRYKCRFCEVKNSHGFSELALAEVRRQVAELSQLYGESLGNYNSVFLGQHDALGCHSSLVLASAEAAYVGLGIADASIRGANLFLFGSVDSLLNAEESLFQGLRASPFEVYINIGFESADRETLAVLGKPLSVAKVREGFARMQEINASYPNIEVSGNFVMDAKLPAGHTPRLLELVRDGIPRKRPKGSIYLSPLRFGAPSRELVFNFNRLKLASRLPTFLYLIQRL